jgi:putative ATP-dependent endonuclease of OLD family
LIATKDGTCVNTTANLKLSESDFSDLSRYIDVKRGEVYTAKGVIFVEGIAEEYLVPSFAKAMGLDLDRLGVVVCNINSTNFKPYCDFAGALGIPHVVITDGDYYHAEGDDKCYNDLEDASHQNKGFDGLDRCHDMFSDVEGKDYDKWSFSERREHFATLGAFVGEYTLEVDIFKTANENDQKIVSSVFNQLTKGGERQKRNFENELSTGQYNTCLAKIEASHSGIGKGRFAQRLANMVSETMIPRYISKAIESIAAKVR